MLESKSRLFREGYQWQLLKLRIGSKKEVDPKLRHEMRHFAFCGARRHTAYEQRAIGGLLAMAASMVTLLSQGGITLVALGISLVAVWMIAKSYCLSDAEKMFVAYEEDFQRHSLSLKSVELVHFIDDPLRPWCLDAFAGFYGLVTYDGTLLLMGFLMSTDASPNTLRVRDAKSMVLNRAFSPDLPSDLDPKAPTFLLEGYIEDIPRSWYGKMIYIDLDPNGDVRVIVHEYDESHQFSDVHLNGTRMEAWAIDGETLRFVENLDELTSISVPGQQKLFAQTTMIRWVGK